MQGYALIATGQVAAQLPALTISLPDGPPTTMTPGTPTNFAVKVTSGAENVVPGSPTLHYRYDGGSYETSPLVPDTGDLYTATLPGAGCADTPEFYVSAEGDGGGDVTDPSDAPASVYSVLVGEFALAFDDTMETDQGWTVGYAGDDATTGIWNRMNPEATDAQPEDDHTPTPGTICWVTDGRAGASLGTYDVDGGRTTIVSPISDLSGVADATISYWRWYSNDTGSNPDTDTFRVDVTNNGSTWVNVETLGAAFGGEHTGGWYFHEFQVANFVTSTANVRVRFVAEDLTANGGSLVEAAVDDFQVSTFVCLPPLPGDSDGDGDVDLDDYAFFPPCMLGPGGGDAGCEVFDMDADNDVDLVDAQWFQAAFTGPL
jgi:hypothetical protein